ncbi:Uncharacterized protein Rs2_29212 [Raphanus sativus]|nr:Uncharacterized protein Rs2_29212 [Raphanus sativus]
MLRRFSGVISRLESASCPSSHPGTVVLVLLTAEASTCSIWDAVQGVMWRLIHSSFGGDRKAWRKLQVWLRSSGTSYSGNVKGTPGILGNEENLTFPRDMSMVENGYRSRRISKTN